MCVFVYAKWITHIEIIQIIFLQFKPVCTIVCHSSNLGILYLYKSNSHINYKHICRIIHQMMEQWKLLNLPNICIEWNPKSIVFSLSSIGICTTVCFIILCVAFRFLIQLRYVFGLMIYWHKGYFSSLHDCPADSLFFQFPSVIYCLLF